MASPESLPQPQMYADTSSLSALGKKSARGMASTFTSSPTRAHMAAIAVQIFSSLM